MITFLVESDFKLTEGKQVHIPALHLELRESWFTVSPPTSDPRPYPLELPRKQNNSQTISTQGVITTEYGRLL